MAVAALVVVLLVLVNALYVAAEFASVSVRRSRVRRLANEGSRLAALLRPEIESPASLDRYVAVCQVGITLSSLVLGAYGQARIAPALAPLLAPLEARLGVSALPAAVALVLVGLTVFQMVGGELVPKSLALWAPTRVALATVVPMRWSLVLFSWFNHLLNGSGRLLLRALRVPEAAHRHVHSPEEIDILFAESARDGSLEPGGYPLLRRALELRLRRASHLMTPRVGIAALEADQPREDIVEAAVSSPFTRIPVYRGQLDDIVGILHVKDLAEHFMAHGSLRSLEEILRPGLVVPEQMPLERLLDTFRARREQLALVVDEYGGITGLITATDLLSEVIGDIPDEFKMGRARPELLADGRVRLPGRTPLDRASRWTGASWSGESDTVAGLVLETAGRLPREGDVLRIGGLEVVVERVHGNAVQSVLVRPSTGGEATR